MYFKGYTCRILLLWYVSTGILSLSLRVELTSALCQKHCTNQEDLIQSNLVSPLSSKHHFIKSSMLIVVAHCGFCWFCVIVASTMNHICSLSSMFFFFLFTVVILCFHSRSQHLCKFIVTNESVCIRKEFNSHRTGLGHQHGHRFIVLGHKYGCRDVMWKHTIVIVAGLAVIYYSYQLNYDTTAEINHSLHNYLFSLLLIKAVVVDGFSAVVESNYPWFKPFTTVFSCGCFLCFYSGWCIKHE